jgi:hypothetical protein
MDPDDVGLVLKGECDVCSYPMTVTFTRNRNHHRLPEGL